MQHFKVSTPHFIHRCVDFQSHLAPSTTMQMKQIVGIHHVLLTTCFQGYILRFLPVRTSQLGQRMLKLASSFLVNCDRSTQTHSPLNGRQCSNPRAARAENKM